MRYLVLVLLTIFAINTTTVYAQTDAEIQALMKQLELLKKKKAMEEKEKTGDVAKTEIPSADSDSSITPEPALKSVFNNIQTSEELENELARINRDNLTHKMFLDSVKLINEFERDSATLARLNTKRDIALLIDNNEVDSVLITVGDKEYGKVKVPYLITDAKQGWHRIVVKNDWGFVDYKEGLYKQDSIYKLQFNAGIPRSAMTINSTPKQAEISINDSVVGLSPVTVEGLKPGTYKIGMKMTGFSSYETNVELNGLFSPELYAELNEEIPESYKPVYTQPKKIAGAVLGTAALITGIMGIVKHSTAGDYFDDAEKNSAKSDEYRNDGDYASAAEELTKEQKNNDLGTEKKDSANTLLIISFVTLSFSVPLLTF